MDFTKLYRSVKTCERMQLTHKKKTALAVELIQLFKNALPKREVVIVGDNAIANREVITKLPRRRHHSQKCWRPYDAKAGFLDLQIAPV